MFVARVVPGGMAAHYGVRENDKVLTINAKTPRNVDDAVALIKHAGPQIKLVVLREDHEYSSSKSSIEQSSAFATKERSWSEM